MSAKNTRGGCGCESCRYTHAQKVWPELELDQAKLARYVRAKTTGKMPSDSAYSAHRSFAMRTPDREFTAAELGNRSVKVYHAPGAKPDYVEIPGWGWKTTEDYIAAFDQKNSLRSAAYEFCQPAALVEAA